MSDRVVSLEGRWQMVRAFYQGAAAPEEVTARTVLEFSKSSYLVSFDGKPTEEGRLEYSPSGLANSLRLIGTQGTHPGRTILCLFRQVGDRLRICYGLDGVLPADFAVPQGNNRYLATYRRIASA
jgi:uncharacterized protein (TIGR03067 family)